VISIEHASKRYGNKYAVNDVSFTIQKGEIVGFLGRNGAGKTTTMNMVTGYISSSSGKITVDGYDILTQPLEVKRRIGYLPEQPPLYLDMTVDEYLEFVCRIKHVARPQWKKHLGRICEMVRITDVRHRLIKNLSKGYRQRVGLSQALIGSPDVLIMDEPTVGLDPRQIIEIRSLIKDLGKEHTVVLSSHILHEVADVCERVVIIDKGKLVAQDTLENLTRRVGDSNRLSLRVDGPESEIKAALKQLDGVAYVEAQGMREPGTCDFVLECDKEIDARRSVFALMSDAKWPLLQMRSMDMTLEDIFIQLTTDGDSREDVDE